jgi:hypothetical protein
MLKTPPVPPDPNAQSPPERARGPDAVSASPRSSDQRSHRRLEVRAALLCAAIVAACAWPATTSGPDMRGAFGRGIPLGRTFYVSTDGRDRYQGTDPGHPWRTIRRVNRAVLRPGDTVLFRGGETFTDDTLMPGGGVMVSGTAGSPVTFASYGSGRATLTKGIWLGTNPDHPRGPKYLTFKNLALGPQQGFQGTGDQIALVGLQISDVVRPYSLSETGIRTEGSHWLIAGNQIDGTGDSGMLLGFNANAPGDPAGGEGYVVDGNVIRRTGLDPARKGTHGIYLKVTDATISHNSITDFRDDGISVRYHGAQIRDNYIAHGSIGIAWFQYDTTPGTSSFADNTIVDTRSAAIFVCGVIDSCARPIEHFVIRGNRVIDPHGALLNLQRDAARYVVGGNTVRRGR